MLKFTTRCVKIISVFMIPILVLLSIGMAPVDSENIVDYKDEITALQNLKEGVDYVESQAFFQANSLHDAEIVANKCGADLVSFSDNIAVIHFNTSLQYALNECMQNTTEVLLYPDYRLQICSDNTDPYFAQGWQWFHDSIKDTEAHSIDITGKDIKVAVIDTGIAYWHEDLKKCYAGGYDFCNNDKDPADDNGHGTHCAGIIAAEKDNGLGVVGIAPDAKILAYKAFDELGFGNMSDSLRAINRAIQDEADVISMSYTTSHYTSAYQTVINKARNKGIVLIAAAGNNRSNSIAYPAGYDGVISVAASTNNTASLASYSNYGDWIDIVAPGGAAQHGNRIMLGDGEGCDTEILSTWHEDIDKSQASSYANLQGTSMACPMVTGTAALIKSASPLFKEKSYTASERVVDIILSTTDKITYASSNGSVVGGLQTDEAVRSALSYNVEDCVKIYNQYNFPTSCNIAIGSAIQLKLKNPGGSTLKGSSKAIWTSNSDTITVNKKTGRVTAKYAKPGDTAIITATMPNDKSYSYMINAVPYYKRFGIWQKRIFLPNTGHVVYDKNYLNQDVYVNCNDIITLKDPYNLLKPYGDLELLEYYEPIKNSNASYKGIPADDTKQYRITISKTILPSLNIYTKQSNGDIENISFQYPGCYSVKYKTADGSNRQFTIRFIVRIT